MRESNFWKWLRNGWRLEGPSLQVTRIETGTMTGVPDVEVCYEGTAFWVELKAVDRPVRPDTPVDVGLSPAQSLWHRKRMAAGGTSYLLVAVGDRQERRLYLLRGEVVATAVTEDIRWVRRGDSFSMTEDDLMAVSVCNQRSSAPTLLKIMTSDLYGGYTR